MAALLAALAAPEPARAQDARAQAPCGRSGRPWVSVAFSGQAWDRELQSAVLEDLRAGLRLKGIDACSLGAEGSEPPLALLELQAEDQARFSVGIAVHDALTEKRVLRDLDLRALSADARALAIAAATDELLRASWAELALADAPEPTREPPAEVQASVRTSIAPARVGRRDHGVGVRGALEHQSGGHTQLGGDAMVVVWFTDRVGFELGVGLRRGLTRDAEHGEVESRTLTGAAQLAYAILPRGNRFGLDAKLGLALSSVRMRGSAVSGAEDAEGAGIDVHARAGLGLSLALLPALALRADVAGGAPLRHVEAVDDGEVVSSTGGVELQAGLGTELRF